MDHMSLAYITRLLMRSQVFFRERVVEVKLGGLILLTLGPRII